MLHAVGIGYLTYHPCRYACRKAAGRYITGHHASRTDNASVTYGHTGTDYRARSYPAIVSYTNRLCVAETSLLAVGTQHFSALLGDHRVNGGNYGHVGTEVAVVAYSDLRVVLYRYIEIKEALTSHLGMYTVMEGDGPLKKGPFTYLTDDLHNSGYSPNYVSEHEAMYAGRGMAIHFLIARMVDLPEDFVLEVDGHRIDQVEVGADIRKQKARERAEAKA